VYGRHGVIPSRVMAGEVTDQSADAKPDNLLLFDGLNQPFVDVELLLPFGLLIHDCPRRGKLVIMDDDAAGGFFLEVNCTGDDHPIDRGK